MTSNKSQQELRRDLNIILVIAGCPLESWQQLHRRTTCCAFFFFSVWKPSIKKELDLGNSLIPLLSSFHHSLISPSSLLYRKVQQAKQSSSSCSFFFLKTHARQRWMSRNLLSSSSEHKQQQGFLSPSLSPLTNNDKWRRPDEVTARVCLRNKDKHARLEGSDSELQWSGVDTSRREETETSLT